MFIRIGALINKSTFTGVYLLKGALIGRRVLNQIIMVLVLCSLSFASYCNAFRHAFKSKLLHFYLNYVDPRSDLKPADIAEEFDRMWEMWARGIPYGEDAAKESGKTVIIISI